MSLSYGDLRRWDAGKVGDAAECLRQGIRKLERASETMSGQTFPSGWSGRGATAAAITRNRLTHQLEIQARIRSVLVTKVFATEDAVAVIGRRVAALDDAALSQEFRIADDGSISDEHDYGFPTPDDLVKWLARRGQLDALVDERDKIMALAVRTDGDLMSAMTQAVDNDDPGDDIGLPSQEVQDEWATLTDDERREILENMAADLAEKYGVPTYSITFGTLPPGTLGTHDPTTHEITISTDYLDDPVVLNTIVHEMMHAGHDAGLDGFPGLTPAEIEELRDNEDNYRSSRNDWEDYRYQPEEDITRSEADDYVADLTTDDLDEYR